MITIPMRDGQTVSFPNWAEVAKHYADLADSYRKSARKYGPRTAARHKFNIIAETYDKVAWQMYRVEVR